MERFTCRCVLRTAHALLLCALAASPAFAQSPITVVSPHAGEQVDGMRPYFVRWTSADIPGSTGFVVYAIDASGATGSVCLAAPAERNCEWFEPFRSDVPSGRIVVEARDRSGVVLASGQSGPFELVDANLGAEWQSLDFGDVGRSGGARGGAGPGEWEPTEVRGAGADIWGTADAFHYVFREMGPGDLDASATITAVEGTEPWTKVGLMVRNGFLPDSAHHFVLASRSKGVAYQRRPTPGGATLHTGLSASSALPVRVELMRRAGYNVINVKQGSGAWQQVAAFEDEGMRLVGFAVTSHNRAELATGRFSDVHVDIGHEAVTILSLGQEESEIPAGVPYTIRWTHGEPVNVATVSSSVDNGQTWTVVPGCASIAAMSCVWNNPGPESERARIRVVMENPANRRAWTVTYPFAIRSAPPTTLPAGWTSGDVGAVAVPGSASHAAGQFTVEGSGSDIWGAADEFHFVSRAMPRGEEDGFELTARVVSVQNVNQWTKVGLMIRNHRGAGAAHASVFVTPSTVKGVAFQRRRGDGAASVHTAGPAITAPVWLKLVQNGGHVRAYYRHRTTDPWTFLAADDIRYSAGAYEAGLAVSSHVDGTLARATFDNVTVRPLEYFGDTDIGAVGLAGTTESDDVITTLEGSGADIWGTADAFRYRLADIGPRGSIAARVLAVENTHAWAKAGVMIREDLSPGARHVMFIVSPGKGIAMQYRATPNGTSANVAIVSGAAPAWLRLARDGASVAGEVSTDGLTWREVGRVTLPMGDFVTAGLAVTSHNNSTLATAVFDDVIVTR